MLYLGVRYLARKALFNQYPWGKTMNDKTEVLNKLQDAMKNSGKANFAADIKNFLGSLGGRSAQIAFENLVHDEIKRVLPSRLKWAAPVILALASIPGIYGMNLSEIQNHIQNTLSSRGGNMSNQNQTPTIPAGIDVDQLSSGVVRTLRLMLLVFNADHAWDTMDSPFEVITQAHHAHGDTAAAMRLDPTTRKEFEVMERHLNFLRDVRANMMAATTAPSARRIYSQNYDQIVRSGHAVEVFIENKCILYWDTVSSRTAQSGGGLAEELMNQVKETTTRLFGAVDDASSVYQRIILKKTAVEGAERGLSFALASAVMVPQLLASAILIACIVSSDIKGHAGMWWFFTVSLMIVSTVPAVLSGLKTGTTALGTLLVPLCVMTFMTVMVTWGDMGSWRVVIMAITSTVFTATACALMIALPAVVDKFGEALADIVKAILPGTQLDIAALKNIISSDDMDQVRLWAKYTAIGVAVISALIVVVPNLGMMTDAAFGAIRSILPAFT